MKIFSRLLFILLFSLSLCAMGENFPIWLVKSLDTQQAREAPDSLVAFGQERGVAKIRALYLNRCAADPESGSFARALRKAESTQINAFVIDIKDVSGNLSYRSAIAQAIACDASRNAVIEDLKSYLSELKAMGIYTIARIAVFKDRRQATHFPDRAIRRSDGRIFRERGSAWIDPHNREGREYSLKIAEEVAKLGFDEINFDYIRFPAKTGLCCYRSDTQKNRVAAIESFLKEAYSRLHPLGVKLSVDIFGYVLWNRDDLHIGQKLESIAPYVDYICPMLYPSGFFAGTMGLRNPAANPYRIVKGSLKKGIARVSEGAIFRPWLQSFRDYAFDRRGYGRSQIAREVLAAEELGSSGWMLWNPSSRYPHVDGALFALKEKMSDGSISPKVAVSFRVRRRSRHRLHHHRRRAKHGKRRSSPAHRRKALDILRVD
jgi:hypothetical protein